MPAHKMIWQLAQSWISICLLCSPLLINDQCLACEPSEMKVLQHDLESALSGRSFLNFLAKHGETGAVELALENENDEEQATKKFQFENLASLAQWLEEKHRYMASVLIPEKVMCGSLSCEYTLPQLTVHHAAYLLEFEVEKINKRLVLKRVHIYWA